MKDFLANLMLRSLRAHRWLSLKFYSRFTTSKFFNKYFSQPTAGASISAPTVYPELVESRDEKGSQVYLEKAYADVTVGDSGFIFSFGRLPTMDGPFVHYPNGKARSGTYPALLYNSSLDGIAGSYNLKSEAGDFSARLFYTPTTYLASSAGTTNKVPSYQTSPIVGGGRGNTTNTLTSLMLEYSKKMEGVGDLSGIRSEKSGNYHYWTELHLWHRRCDSWRDPQRIFHVGIFALPNC